MERWKIIAFCSVVVASIAAANLMSGHTSYLPYVAEWGLVVVMSATFLHAVTILRKRDEQGGLQRGQNNS